MLLTLVVLQLVLGVVAQATAPVVADRDVLDSVLLDGTPLSLEERGRDGEE